MTTSPDQAPPIRRPARGWVALALVALLAALAGLSVHADLANSVTRDEPHHLRFGGHILETGRVTRDVPHYDGLLPWAALPALVAGIRGEGLQDDGQLFRARLVSTACLVALAALVFVAILDLTRMPALALAGPAMMLVSPNLLAHGSLCTTDLPIALFWTTVLVGGLLTLRGRPRLGWALMAAGLSLALLTKTTGLFLAALLPAVLAVAGWVRREGGPGAKRAALWGVGAVAAAMVLLHVAHLRTAGFHDWNASVREANEVLEAFPIELPTLPHREGRLLVPLPGSYLTGLQLLRAHELRGHHAYLMGVYSSHGRRGYYPLLLLLKTPIAAQLALLVAATLAVVDLVRRRRTLEERDVVLLAPCLLYLLYSSLFNSLNLGIRHMLVIVPAVQIWLLCEASRVRGKPAAIAAVAAVLFAGAAAESWSVQPYPLSFFNRYLGGPQQAWRYVNDSNLDWGQEDRLLEDYLDASAAPVVVRPTQVVTGQIAVSANDLTHPPDTRGRRPFDWATHEPPLERVGRVWFIYEVAPPTTTPRTTARESDPVVPPGTPAPPPARR